MLSDGAVDHVLFPRRERMPFHGEAARYAFGLHRCWLATDRLLVENGEVPSDMELGKDAEAIATFAATFRERPGARTQRATPYHPAVRAIGIALVLHGKTVHREIVEIERVKRDAGGVLAAAQGTACVEVRVVAVDSGSPRLKAYQRSVTLDLPRGARSPACGSTRLSMTGISRPDRRTSGMRRVCGIRRKPDSPAFVHSRPRSGGSKRFPSGRPMACPGTRSS